MEHILPPLPFPKEALEPHISRETIDYHYDKHHRAYVDKLNKLIKGTRFENADLNHIIMESEGPVFNNAAQHFNHTFFWNCLTPKSTPLPGGKLGQMINDQWGSFDKFKENFNKQAVENFGSGWSWLIQNAKGQLEIMNTSNADTPIKYGLRALLSLDVWEHAYYIDYRNDRKKYTETFWKVVNWDFAQRKLENS